jgi:hypothetical protein
MHRLPCLLGLAVLAAACGGDDGGPCDPMTESCTFAKDVSTITVGGGIEEEDTCQSWTLNNPTELWVNGVSESNDGAYHHANWFFVPDDMFALPDGTWKCSEHSFSELNAAVVGGYLFALSTQSALEHQKLPDGSGIRIPPYSRIIGSSHLLNASPDDVTTTMHLEIHTIPPADVKAKMAPARIQYHDLKLDPMARSSFTAECKFKDAYATQINKPFAWELHYVLSHYHSLGSYARLEIAGGPRDGEVIMEHTGFGENFGVALEPLHLRLPEPAHRRDRLGHRRSGDVRGRAPGQDRDGVGRRRPAQHRRRHGPRRRGRVRPSGAVRSARVPVGLRQGRRPAPLIQVTRVAAGARRKVTS